jgi:hypothetical protein
LRLAVTRDRFGGFTLSTRKRLLIPRCLDLLIPMARLGAASR